MGNSTSLNKAARRAADKAKKNGDGCGASNLELLAAMREELELHGQQHYGGGRTSNPSKSKDRKSSRGDKKNNRSYDAPLSMDEIVQLHNLVKQLSQEKEGQDLLKQFIEQQAGLGVDPSIPPITSIMIPQEHQQQQPQKKSSKSSRAA